MREIIISTLKRKIGIVAVILFGSQTKHEQRRDSDVDIAILFRHRNIPNAIQIVELKEELSNALSTEVDIICLNNASPIICMQVFKNGVTLIMSDKLKYDRFVLKSLAEYADLKYMRKSMEKNILKRKFYG